MQGFANVPGHFGANCRLFCVDKQFVFMLQWTCQLKQGDKIQFIN